MEIRPNDVGKLVELPFKADWGPGKIMKVENGYAYIHFRDDGDRMAKKYHTGENPLKWAPNQSDPALDHLSTAPKPRGRAAAERHLEFPRALDLFKARYPLGFNDPAYLGNSLDREKSGLKYLSSLFRENLGDGKLEKMLESGDSRVIADKALFLLSSQGLLGKEDLAAFKASLMDAAEMTAYFTALGKVLGDNTVDHDCMHPYFKSILSNKTPGFAKWPVATLFPFLARPSHHMFLKPQVVKVSTALLGIGFLYEAQLGWRTYHSLLAAANEVLEKLKPLGARDFLDIQAFLTFVQKAAKDKTAV